jgi:hypothetical protein
MRMQGQDRWARSACMSALASFGSRGQNLLFIKGKNLGFVFLFPLHCLTLMRCTGYSRAGLASCRSDMRDETTIVQVQQPGRPARVRRTPASGPCPAPKPCDAMRCLRRLQIQIFDCFPLFMISFSRSSPPTPKKGNVERSDTVLPVHELITYVHALPGFYLMQWVNNDLRLVDIFPYKKNKNSCFYQQLYRVM